MPALWQRALCGLLTTALAANPVAFEAQAIAAIGRVAAGVFAGLAPALAWAQQPPRPPSSVVGQSLGQSLLSGVPRPGFDAGSQRFTLPSAGPGGSTTVPFGQLFPQSRPDHAADIGQSQANYGNHAGFGGVVDAARARLATEQSPTGDAWRLLQRGNPQSRPRLQNDPIARASDRVLQPSNPFFAGCTTERVTLVSRQNAHVPKYETCDRTFKYNRCEVKRVITGIAESPFCGSGVNSTVQVNRNEVDIMRAQVLCSPDAHKTGRQPVAIDAFGTEGNCGSGPKTVELSTDRVVDKQPLGTLTPHWYGACRPLAVSYSVPKPCAATDEECSLSLQFALTAFNETWAPTATAATRTGMPACAPGTTEWNGQCYSCPDGAQFSAGQCLRCDRNPATGNPGTLDGNGQCSYAQTGDAWTLNLTYPRFRRHIGEQLIDQPAGCARTPFCIGAPEAGWVSSGSLNDQASTAAWQCTDASNDRVFNGVPITPAEWGPLLQELYPGAPPMPPSPICYRAEARHFGCNFNVGPMDCWLDTEGHQRCPYSRQELDPQGRPVTYWCERVDGVEQGCIAENSNTCDALEQRSECVFKRSDCAIGGRDPHNDACFVYTDTYDCGFGVPIETPAGAAERYVCPGAIRCLGNDCLATTPEVNGDFQRASAILSSANFIQMDTNCVREGQCEVFKGAPYSCKKAVGGLVNCCKKPQGVNALDYVRLAYSTWSLTKDLSTLDALKGIGADVHGAWTTLTEPISATYSSISESVVSAWDSLLGRSTVLEGGAGTAEATTSLFGDLGISSIKQAMLNATVNWAVEMFPGAASAILGASESAGALFYTNAGGNVALNVAGNAFAAILWWIMVIYMIIQIIMILIQLIWKCEKSEFELGAKREMNVCVQAGSYCKSRFLGVCIEKRDSYCCFSSPLARIVQEQGRQQLGKPWGSPENPQCSGFTLEEMGRIDWSRLDLQEWLATLKLAGINPPSIDDADQRFGPTKTTTRRLPSSEHVPQDFASATTADILRGVLQRADPEAVRANIRRQLP